MREFQEKRRLKKILYSKSIVAILAILVLFFAQAVWNMYRKERESAANALRAQAELARLKERQALLDAEVGRLQTDEGVEEEIRSKYSVSKPGENVVVIVDKGKTQTEPVQSKEGWWDKFKKIFK